MRLSRPRIALHQQAGRQQFLKIDRHRRATLIGSHIHAYRQTLAFGRSTPQGARHLIPEERPNMADRRPPEIARRTLGKPAHELDEEERQVIAVSSRPTEHRDAADVADESSTWGDRADRVAAVGGSWGFIIPFR
jgi:hypothetical protein